VQKVTTEVPDRTDREFLTSAEAAAYLRLSLSTLAKLRMTGAGPGFLKVGRVGRKVLYQRSVLDAWLDSRRRRNTSEAPNG
jgi:hypothetical protein